MRRYAITVEAAGSLVVVTTPSGYANALAQAIDEAAHPAIAGTIAGDNTIFVAARDGISAQSLHDELAGLSPAGSGLHEPDRRRRLLGRARHELHPRVAEGGLVRLRRGRRRARRRRAGVRPRGVDRARAARPTPTTSSSSTARTRSPTSSARARSSRTRCTRASTRSSRRSRGRSSPRRSRRSRSTSAPRRSSTAAPGRATTSSASSSPSRRTTRA